MAPTILQKECCIINDSNNPPTCTFGPHGAAPWDAPCEELDPYDFMTPEQYLEYVNKRLQDIERIISENIITPLTQNQYDALVCLLWNVGPENLTSTKSTSGGALLNAINSEPPHWDEAADIIANYAPGESGYVYNKERRQREAELFRNGVYNHTSLKIDDDLRVT